MLRIPGNILFNPEPEPPLLEVLFWHTVLLGGCGLYSVDMTAFAYYFSSDIQDALASELVALTMSGGRYKSGRRTTESVFERWSHFLFSKLR